MVVYCAERLAVTHLRASSFEVFRLRGLSRKGLGTCYSQNWFTGDVSNVRAASALAAALADASLEGGWSYVAVQLYDESSCLYSRSDMQLSQKIWSAVNPSKMLLGIPQGVVWTTCCTDFTNASAGFVEWLHRPMPCPEAAGCTTLG
eukprot:TRINITY_DN9765_c0_g1_i3.p1 TRINITY_DN9765_c0_g1~~TRINITY_DN9765_c0_g1_i3.p1  ORF type:complete len:147 (+),score=12.92 TRINITY_DN9765_c0_g1_i3:121-561(+)